MQQGDPIEERFKEYTERGAVIDQLAYCINSYREAAVSADPKFDHIDISEKQKVSIVSVSSRFMFGWLCKITPHQNILQVLNECVEAEAWLREKKQHQDSLPKHATPVLLSADVRKKAEALDRLAICFFSGYAGLLVFSISVLFPFSCFELEHYIPSTVHIFLPLQALYPIPPFNS